LRELLAAPGEKVNILVSHGGKYALYIDDESRHRECRQAGDHNVFPEMEMRRG
jgi:hypothetical protein